jgi:two-component system, cell cycle sensor histidine kinase and response regulator CckA
MKGARKDPAARILLIEDDPDVRETMADILDWEGFRVERAANGRDALERLRSDGPLPDAILLDLMMPVMNGWQFRVEQRKDLALCQIPVIALSADHSPRAQAVDADAFLQKPVESDVLVRTVSDVVRAGRARREEAERLAHTERLTTLGHLAAAVAHEINNPLGWVVGNLNVIATRLADPALLAGRLEDTQAAVREAIEGAERIQAIVGDIGTFTRRVDEPAVVFDLSAEARTLLRLLDRQLQGRARVVVEGAPCCLVQAPPGRVRQVLMNLIVNAADAIADVADPGHRDIQVTLGLDGARLRVEVSDTGNGIPACILGKIFDPFFTTKAAGKGTGLGLFVCRGLVKAMGSELEVHSEVGVGTCFRFWLPPGALQRPAGAEAEAAAEPGVLQVLVVDDEPGILRVLERQLLGHRVRRATSAEEALRELEQNPQVDIILTDVYMPGMGGRGLYEALARRPGGLHHRVLFMTGGLLDERTLQFARALPERVLQKPVELGELSAAIARILDGVQVPAVAAS